MPAIALATGRATLAGQVDGDGPDERGYPGSPGRELGVRLTTSPCKKLIVTKPYNKPRNVMNNRRRQRITDLTFDTWDFQTMLQPGKMMEIADETLKLDLVAIQEIRWQVNGEINKKIFTVIYSGPENRTVQYGTGLIVSIKIKERILEWGPVNDRFCRIRITGKFRNLTIISGYASTEDKREEEKVEFYSKLQIIYSRVPKYM